jgi:branched-chain amino acid transport system substrate-binding protein
MQAAMQKYAHFSKSQFPNLGQYESWAGADLMIKGLQKAGPNPTQATAIKDLRSIRSYNANGLLPHSLNYTNNFRHDPPQTCAWVMKAGPNGFTAISSKPSCGKDIPGTSTAS